MLLQTLPALSVKLCILKSYHSWHHHNCLYVSSQQDLDADSHTTNSRRHVRLRRGGEKRLRLIVDPVWTESARRFGKQRNSTQNCSCRLHTCLIKLSCKWYLGTSQFDDAAVVWALAEAYYKWDRAGRRLQFDSACVNFVVVPSPAHTN